MLLTLEPRGLVVLLMVVAHATCVTHNGRCGIASLTGSIQNCVTDSDDVILIVPGSNLEVHNCMMSTPACVHIKKQIKTATMHYSCTLSSGTKLAGTADLCNPEKSFPKQLVEAMTNLNIPTKCPMEISTVCPTDTSKVNMTGYKTLLPAMNGTSSCTFNIQTDSGKCCLKGNITIRKLNRTIIG